MKSEDIVCYTRARQEIKQKQFIEDLELATTFYVFDLLERGRNGELNNDELYIYLKYKTQKVVIVPTDTRVVVKREMFRLGEMLELFTNGKYMPARKLEDFNRSSIQQWMTSKGIQLGYDKKDRLTKELVDALKGYVDNLVTTVEYGKGTERQNWEYNKMKLGEPLEILSEASVEKSNGGKYKLIHRLKTVCGKESEFYYNDIVQKMLDEYNIVYKSEDKDALRQKELLTAIERYKKDIITRHEKNSLKKKEQDIYNNIMNNEPFMLPYRLMVNIGTRKYPIEIQLGRTIELMEEKILDDKRSILVTDDMDFVCKVMDMGVKLDDKVVDRVNAVRANNQQPSVV